MTITGNDRGIPEPGESLQVLLGRIEAGDANAFEDLYSRTVRRLYALALGVIRDRGMAEDVVQEVYVHVWSLAGRYNRSLGTPLAWLFTLTHRRAVDRVRREQSALEHDSRHQRETSALGQELTEDLALRRLRAEEVHACLSTLSARQSEAIVLAYLGGHTQTEVAAALKITVPAVKSRIRDGLSRMRLSLERAGRP
ncbi:RNA polymerase sigma-70 factor (ECF subfamily) [Arthrobacter sp. UYCu712]